MKTTYLSLIVLCTPLFISSCCKDYGNILPEVDLAGNPGNPSFNLQFDN